MSEPDEVEAALAALRRGYAAELPDLVRSLAARMEEAATRPSALDQARREAHRLRGTAGSYGFAAVGEAAGRIEDALEEGRSVTPDLLGELAGIARQAAGGSSRSSK